MRGFPAPWVAVPVELSDGTAAVARADQAENPERDEPCRAGRYRISCTG